MVPISFEILSDFITTIEAVLPAGPLFAGCPKFGPVARYHSLAVDADTIPDFMKILARTTDGEVMAVCHKDYPIYGLQFHPESIMTPSGKQIIKNFIKGL